MVIVLVSLATVAIGIIVVDKSCFKVKVVVSTFSLFRITDSVAWVTDVVSMVTSVVNSLIVVSDSVAMAVARLVARLVAMVSKSEEREGSAIKMKVTIYQSNYAICKLSNKYYISNKWYKMGATKLSRIKLHAAR